MPLRHLIALIIDIYSAPVASRKSNKSNTASPYPNRTSTSRTEDEASLTPSIGMPGESDRSRVILGLVFETYPAARGQARQRIELT